MQIAIEQIFNEVQKSDDRKKNEEKTPKPNSIVWFVSEKNYNVHNNKQKCCC